MTIEADTDEGTSSRQASAMALMADLEGAVIPGASSEDIGGERESEAEHEQAGTPPAEPPQEAKAEPPKEVQDWLAEKARASQEAREAAETLRAEREAAAERERRLEEREKSLERRLAKLEAFERNPLEAIEDPKKFYSDLQSRALDKGGHEARSQLEEMRSMVTAFRDEMKSLREELTSTKQETKQQIADREYRQAAQEFVSHATRNAEKYPLSSRVPPDELVQKASHFAQLYNEAGETCTYDDLLARVEKEYRARLELFGAQLPEQKEPAGSGVKPKTPAAEHTESGPNNTLTNASSAATSSDSPMTARQREKSALSMLDSWAKEAFADEYR